MSIITLTNHRQPVDTTAAARELRKAGAPAISEYGGHGVWVPPGMTAGEIMVGAAVLEDKFEVPPFQSRSMVRAVLAAIREANVGSRQS